MGAVTRVAALVLALAACGGAAAKPVVTAHPAAPPARAQKPTHPLSPSLAQPTDDRAYQLFTVAGVLTAAHPDHNLAVELMKRIGLMDDGGLIVQDRLSAFNTEYADYVQKHADWVVQMTDPAAAQAFWDANFAAAQRWEPPTTPDLGEPETAPPLPEDLPYELFNAASIVCEADHDDSQLRHVLERLGIMAGSKIDRAAMQRFLDAYAAWAGLHTKWMLEHALIEDARKFLAAHEHDPVTPWTR